MCARLKDVAQRDQQPEEGHTLKYTVRITCPEHGFRVHRVIAADATQAQLAALRTHNATHCGTFCDGATADPAREQTPLHTR